MPALKRARGRKAGKVPASPVKTARKVRELVRLRLVAAAAGRCEFRGCNHDLFTHHVTARSGNFAQLAHIVAFRRDGPRGGDGPRPRRANGFDNLMLLCASCHHLIDTKPSEFPVPLLLTHKREHEARIAEITALGPEWQTTVIQVLGAIGGQPVSIPNDDIRRALVPRYPARLPGVIVDLRAIQREDASFFELARDQIRRELQPALRGELAQKPVHHCTVFALAPIPVLACLGRALGNKASIDLMPRHKNRDPTESAWGWSARGELVTYEFRELKKGTDPGSVALLLSLSGRIDLGSLPSNLDDRFFLYELSLRGQDPNVDFLRRREDLVSFRDAYRDALGRISAAHPSLSELHLLPAVPAPIAVACGQDVMPKAHPALVLYDNVKGRFVYAITINTREDL